MQISVFSGPILTSDDMAGEVVSSKQCVDFVDKWELSEEDLVWWREKVLILARRSFCL